jgi:hypothetical protein
MSQGNDFANYSAATDGSTGSEDVWFVAVASDDIKQMNVDQLDEAFRLGIITGETAVWTEGMEAWAPLGQVADLDAESETSGSVPVASHPHSDYPQQNSGQQHSGQQHSGYQQPSQQRSEPAEAARASAFGNVTLQSMQHSFAPGPNSFAPGANSVAPVTTSYAPHLGQSTGPVALEVDEDMPAMRHGRRFRPERWALAAAALVAVGVVGYNNMFSSSVASAGTQAPAASTAPAARPYDGADGAEPGAKLNAKAVATEESPSTAAREPSISPAAAAAAVAVPSAKAAALTANDDEEAPATTGSSRSKAGSDKDSLKGSFSKAFNKKATAAKTAKVKPRKAASRATKPRATRGSKKPGVARSQSAFDPLNDSLP